MKLSDVVSMLENELMNFDSMDDYPKQEAALTYQSYLRIIEDEDEKYAKEWLNSQIKHMLNNVFDNEIDREKYSTELEKLLNQ